MIGFTKIVVRKRLFLEIKRGISAPKNSRDKKLKNDDLAQLYYSFVIPETRNSEI